MKKYERSQKPHDRKAKMLLIGNAGVGKSSILLQFSEKKFSHSYYNTIGVDYKIRYLELHGKTVKLQIWDTAGQDRFRTITSSYYRGADAIAVVYDVTDRLSFDNVRAWLDEIEKYSGSRVVRHLVGNKKDLEEKRQVKYSEGAQLAQLLGLPFKETSARSAADIDGLFEDLVEKLGFAKLDQQKETASKTQTGQTHLAKSEKSSVISLKAQKKTKAASKCCGAS